MKVVVAGGGRIGSQLAGRLVAARHTVAVVDRDPRVCERLFEELGVVTVCGDATDARALEQAGIRSADVAAGLLARDADTLAFALLARTLSDARIMVRVLDDNFLDAYALSGIRDVIAEADAVVARITTSIEFPRISGSLPIGKGDAILFELAIPLRGRVVGRRLGEVQASGRLPKGCLLVGVIDPEGRIELPTQDTVLRGGDVALVVARREQVGDAVASLTSEEETSAPISALIEAVRGIEMFKPFRDDELADVLRAIERAHFDRGETIYSIGDPADRLFMVLTGEVTLHDQHGAVAGRAGPREAFGDLDVLAGDRRQLSACAAVDTDVAAIPRAALQQAADANPPLALAMSRALGSELARASRLRTHASGWRALFHKRPPADEGG